MLSTTLYNASISIDIIIGADILNKSSPIGIEPSLWSTGSFTSLPFESIVFGIILSPFIKICEFIL